MDRPPKKVDAAIIAAAAILIGIGLWPHIFPPAPTLVMNQAFRTADEKGIAWDVMLNFTSSSVFAAQTPLTVDIMAKNYGNVDYKSPRVVFSGASKNNPEYINGSAQIAMVNLTKQPNDAFYRGNITLFYQDAGEKCILVDATQTRGTTTIEGRRYTTYPDRCLVNPLTNTVTESTLNVLPVDAKFQYETNRATISFSWVAAGLSVILARDIAKSFAVDYFKKKGSSTDVESTNTTSDNEHTQTKKDHDKPKDRSKS